MLRFARGLRGKLILTYTLVTVLALLALEVLALLGLGAAGLVSIGIDPNRDGYLNDVVGTLPPQARPYLQPGAEDLPGLQAWLEQVAASGQASPPPQYLGDSPAALLVPGRPLYVLSPAGVVLARAPNPGAQPNPVGQTYTAPDTASGEMVQRALGGELFGSRLPTPDANGNYALAVPVAQSIGSRTIVGVVLVSVGPPPPFNWWELWPRVLGLAPTAASVVAVTAVALLVAVAPLGALFGLVMSRGLTRRLAALSAAADAWSEGNFQPLPPEQGSDEISLLGRRLRHMAERIQTLMQSQQALAALQERNRLARELHDTVKQQAFATLMQVRAARNQLSADPAEAERRLMEAEELIRTSQMELGRLIAELRPAGLEGQGLATALRAYAATWAEQSHIPATVSIQNERALPLDTEQALYRVAQEALANAARHSRGSAVGLQLVYGPTLVSLSVSDNGVGFDPRAAAAGFGLESMRQRLAELRGRLTVNSSPAGTTVQAEVDT
ncbi:MAG: histidine kinase [Anaerolineales bacterium]